MEISDKRNICSQTRELQLISSLLTSNTERLNNDFID
jgi:hypothetical protein